jgi:dipeptidyl aminopeptidase/acylaminoacyl peptidase
LLADVAPWLPEDELAPMRPVQYTSRDGLVIHGYLTLPKGVEARNLPVVVNVHGGPWHRDVWGYNPEVQFLANRGYAVLQVNFRGSTGYGRAFWEASFREWGRKMQDDVTDGVQWLIAQGIADPARVAIYGGSYGGYATLAGLAYTPDLYAAGIDYVGVSNLLTFMKSIPPYWKPMLAMLQEMVGDMEKDEAMLRAASPVFSADRIKAPLLIAQGAKDPRVVKSESDQMVEAMRKRGVEVEYLVKDNEGHGFHNEENRFEFYEAMERFLDRHLGPATPK